VSDSPGDDLVFECAHDRVAPAYIIKVIGAVFAVQRQVFLIRHRAASFCIVCKWLQLNVVFSQSKKHFNEKWLKNRVRRSSGTPCLYLVFYLFFSERQPDRTVT
jgi:hypothetical protein